MRGYFCLEQWVYEQNFAFWTVPLSVLIRHLRYSANIKQLDIIFFPLHDFRVTILEWNGLENQQLIVNGPVWNVFCNMVMTPVCCMWILLHILTCQIRFKQILELFVRRPVIPFESLITCNPTKSYSYCQMKRHPY